MSVESRVGREGNHIANRRMELVGFTSWHDSEDSLCYSISQNRMVKLAVDGPEAINRLRPKGRARLVPDDDGSMIRHSNVVKSVQKEISWTNWNSIFTSVRAMEHLTIRKLNHEPSISIFKAEIFWVSSENPSI